MTQNLHVCAIFCRPEVVYDVISGGRRVKTIEGYLVVNFEVASSYSFRDIRNNHFVTAVAEAAVVVAAADVDDSIKRKRIRVSLKKALADNDTSCCKVKSIF